MWHMETEEKWWQKHSDIPIELNDAPIIQNKIKSVRNSDFDFTKTIPK